MTAALAVAPPAAAQVRFVPTGGDDSAALQQLIRQHRHVLINGPELVLHQTVRLADEHGAPLHGVTIEPAPEFSFVRVKFSITRNEANPTDPSRAAFDYDGRFEPGSFLVEPAEVGATELVVRDAAHLQVNGAAGTAFQVGEAVCLNPTSRVPSLDSTEPRNFNDGVLESFRVTAVRTVSSSAVALALDRPVTRAAAARSSAIRCEPIERATFRNLVFESIGTAEPRAAIHMFVAQHAVLMGIRSERYRGYVMILLDMGGRDNLVRDCFAQGVGAGTDWPNGWGIAVEGQQGTLIVNSGASGFSEGIVLNYSMDTWAYGVRVESARAIALDVAPDAEGHPSIRSGFVGGRVWGGGLGASIGPGCVDCRVDVQMTFPYAGVLVGQWTIRPVVQGRIFWPESFGVGLSLLYGGPGDGAATAQHPVIDVLTSCHPGRLALVRGTAVVPIPPSERDGFYVLGPAMRSCSTWVSALP